MSGPEDNGPNLAALLQQAHALIDRRRYLQARQLLATAAQTPSGQSATVVSGSVHRLFRREVG
jgi:hypothetical protein